MSVCAIREILSGVSKHSLLDVLMDVRMPMKFSPQGIMKIPKDYFSPSLERACVYVAMSRVIPVCLQRAFREEKREI